MKNLFVKILVSSTTLVSMVAFAGPNGRDSSATTIAEKFEAAINADKSTTGAPVVADENASAAGGENPPTELSESDLFQAHSRMTYYYGLNVLRSRKNLPQDFLLKPENITFDVAQFNPPTGTTPSSLLLHAEVKNYLPDVEPMLCKATTKFIDGGHRIETTIVWVANGVTDTFKLNALAKGFAEWKDIDGDGAKDIMFTDPAYDYGNAP